MSLIWNPADSIGNYADESFSDYGIGNNSVVYYTVDKK